MRGIRYRMRWRHGKLVSNICYYKFLPKFWVLLLGERIWRRDGSLPRYFDDYCDPDWVMRLWVSTAKFPLLRSLLFSSPESFNHVKALNFLFSLIDSPRMISTRNNHERRQHSLRSTTFYSEQQMQCYIPASCPEHIALSKMPSTTTLQRKCVSQNRCISTRAKCSPANWPYAISFCDILSIRIRFSTQSESADPISLTN